MNKILLGLIFYLYQNIFLGSRIVSVSLRSFTEKDIKNSDLIKNPKSNATEVAQQYDSVLSSLINFHASLATKKISPKPPNPWMTPAILASKTHRRYHERVWRRYPTALNRSRFSNPLTIPKLLLSTLVIIGLYGKHLTKSYTAALKCTSQIIPLLQY